MITLTLSDESVETLDPGRCRIGDNGAVYMQVKDGARGGPFEAKFSRHAQTALAPHLGEIEGKPAVRVGGTLQKIG